MSEIERWRTMAEDLGLQFLPGLSPYTERIELLSKLQGKKIDLDMNQINSVMGGFVEGIIERIMVGMMVGNVTGLQTLVYRDVKHKLASNRPADEYFMNCAIVYPKSLSFTLTIKRGRKLFHKNKIKTGEPFLDKKVSFTYDNDELGKKFFRDKNIVENLCNLYKDSSNFTIRESGIIFQEKNNRLNTERLRNVFPLMQQYVQSVQQVFR